MGWGGGGIGGLLEVGGGGAASQGAHARHKGGAFGGGDDPAGVHEIEEVGALEAVVVGGEDGVAGAVLGRRADIFADGQSFVGGGEEIGGARGFGHCGLPRLALGSSGCGFGRRADIFQLLPAVQEFLGFFFVELEFGAQGFGVAAVETVFGELLLFGETDVAIGLAGDPANVVDALDVLQEGADALETVGDFNGDGVEIQAAALLEIGELGDLQTFEQNLPPYAPGAEGGRFPVVFFEADVVFAEVDADGFEAFKVDGLDVGGRGLEDDLIL